jgi:hypothetical protein
LPTADAYEANDDAGEHAYPLFGLKRRVDATVDFWDDRDDVYKVYLRKGQRLFVSYSGGSTRSSVTLWPPATQTVGADAFLDDRLRRAAPATRSRIAYRAPGAAWFYLEIRIERPGAGPYRLSLAKG